MKKLILIASALLAVPAASSSIAPSAAVAAGSPQFVVSAPQQVELGQPIQISIQLVDAGDAAGYEASAQFDGTATEFGGVYFGADGTSPGNVVTSITRDPAAGVSFAAYTCNIAGCPGDGAGADGRQTLDHTRLRLGTLAAGLVTVSFGPIKVVDEHGAVVAVDVPTSTVQVDVVDPDGQPGDFPAPPASFGLESASATAGPQPDAFDLNHNGSVTYDDVATLTSAWSDARRFGACGAAENDLNGDGCLDIADVQLLAGLGGPFRAEAAPGLRVEAARPPLVVTATNELADTNTGDGVCRTPAGDCSLRAAIYEANALPGPDSITFNIPGPGLHTIQLSSELPIINDSSGGLTIDGYTQPGSSPNTDPLTSNALINVEIRGNGPLETPDNRFGFRITSANNVIRGLAIYNVFTHIELRGPASSGNKIVGNWIGTDAGATFDAPNEQDGGVGVKMVTGANFNVVGTPALADRNVISGTPGTGVAIQDQGSDNNLVQNNIFGLRPNGVGRLQNGWAGVDMQFGAKFNYVGGLGERERNVIAGEPYNGIDFSHEATLNRAVGNFVGTWLDGNSVRTYTEMAQYAVTFKDNATENHLYGNVIGGALKDAIWSKHDYNGRNYVYDNRVGISLSGTPLPNAMHGMFVQGHDFQVGPGNIFANNALGGVMVTAETGARIAQNVSVGNRITGNSFVGNGGWAIDLAPVGLTANDAGDADSGPNTLLNYPVLAPASTTAATGTACGGCRVEIYKAAIDPGNRGEGQKLIGITTARPDGTFSSVVSGVGVGDIIAAIAIDSAGNTSEFSDIAAVTTVGLPPPTDPPPAPGDPLQPPSSTPTSFVPLVPARLLDTRPGFSTVDQQFAATGVVAGGSTLQLKVTGRGGVPGNATAVVLNVTATEAALAGFVTVYPCGSAQPLASSLNFVAGQAVPNAVLAKVGQGGNVCLFTSVDLHLVADVDGYFPPGSSFESLVPARLLDTRPGFSTIDGQSAAGGLVTGGSTVELTVAGRGGVPANATAVVLNVTATEAAIPGFVTVFPCGSAQPLASNLNFVAGQTVPNAVLSPVGRGGKVCLFTSVALHLVADVGGYFPPGSPFASLVPARLLDTRPGSPTVDALFAGGGLVQGGSTVQLPVTGRGGVPADATAVVLNVTATESAIPGFVTVYPCGSAQPLASNVNYAAGQTVPNTVIVGVGTGGTVCLFTSAGTHLVVDIDGYFKPIL